MTQNTGCNPIDIQSYDQYVVAFSGGKDSLACVLHLLEQGIDRDQIELWHHDVDGQEGSTLMDWNCTRDYCRKVAKALDIKLYFSWKVGGFEREMERDESLTAPIMFECPDGTTHQAGGILGKKNTRKMFPQVSANLSVRWCSAYLKIDVGRIAINNQTRFLNTRTLFLSGERAEESAARSNYKTFEDHSCDRHGTRVERTVHHWRPVHAWTEQQVWNIIKRWQINPHPAYYLGWGRLSCMTCIFANANQWASAAAIDSDKVERIAKYEDSFGKTIHRIFSVREQVAEGQPYRAMTDDMIAVARSDKYELPVFVDEWKQPAGAFGDCTGPM